jgi:hypothetical protein
MRLDRNDEILAEGTENHTQPDAVGDGTKDAF